MNEVDKTEKLTADAVIMLAIAGMGFLVDVYDLAIFGVVRIASLNDLGIKGNDAITAGVTLMNWQMAGMAIGGLLWGALGDQRGRKSILLGSILLYSLANVANSFATSIDQYSATRFFAGLGLAGEVGAAMTIAAEVTPRKYRTFGTAGVAFFSTLGAVLASWVGEALPWRIAYLTAGLLGFVLLVARFSLKETDLFVKAKKQAVKHGSLKIMFSSPRRCLRLARCVFAAAPVWFAISILVSFGPEIAPHDGTATLTVASCIFFSSIGESFGEMFSGISSQLLHSRRLTMFVFLLAGAVFSLILLNCPAKFYASLCLPMLFCFGYWSVAITTTAEQFGTNLRATATSLVPNLVRASAIPLTMLFSLLSHTLGTKNSAIATGACCIIAALVSIHFMEETVGKNLDFIEN